MSQQMTLISNTSKQTLLLQSIARTMTDELICGKHCSDWDPLGICISHHKAVPVQASYGDDGRVVMHLDAWASVPSGARCRTKVAPVWVVGLVAAGRIGVAGVVLLVVLAAGPVVVLVVAHGDHVGGRTRVGLYVTHEGVPDPHVAVGVGDVSHM